MTETRAQLEFQAVLDAAVDAVILIDDRGHVETFNRAAERMFGWAAAEIIGQNVSVLMPGTDRRNHDGYISRFISTGEARIIGTGREVEAQRKDGSLFPALLAVGEVAKSQPRRFVGMLHDITIRNHALNALRKSESLLRAAQSIAGIGNFELELGRQDSAHWSDEIPRLLGRPKSEVPHDMDDFIRHVVHPDDRRRFERDWRRTVAELGQLELECRLLRADGDIRTFEVRIQIDSGAQGPVATGTLHDITARKLAEEEVRQSESRLTHFARLSTMGEMAAGLAHEINQPLTAIATFAQAATRMLASPEGISRDDLDEALQQITTQALRAGEVIRRLRSFVKNREISHQPVDCNRLIEDSRLLVEADARINDVRLEIKSALSLPPVNADPVQLQQVLINLIRNAIDATLETPGARRQVSIVTGLTPEGLIELAVVDHGHGLSAEAAEHLFNPFFTTKSGGTGLGLAISRSIIRAHNGRLSHRTTPGGGCTFYFTLPTLDALIDTNQS